MTARAWTLDEVTQLVDWLIAGATAAEIADRTDRTVKAVKRKRDKLPAETKARIEAVRAAAPVRDPVEIAQHRREKMREAREERDAFDAVADQRSLWARASQLFTDIVPRVAPPPPYAAPLRSNKHGIREAALLTLSDWHYGEVVLSERVRGFNAYDSAIAATTAHSIVSNARKLLDYMRRGGYDFPRLVVAVNGDLVTGTIHDLEKYAEGKTITESVFECGLLLAKVLRDLAADFPQVDVFCTTGNHGRLPDARRMEQKAPLRNWDAFVYNAARIALGNVKNVNLVIPNSYSVAYEVFGHTFLQQHGHDIKSWNNIPWYGIQRYTGRIQALEAARNRFIKYYIFGHFHSATSLPHAGGETFVNGSLIGATEYGVHALGVADRPSQWLFGVHPTHGVTHRWAVYPDASARTAAVAAA